jgi:Flp pilus assembly protein TadD
MRFFRAVHVSLLAGVALATAHAQTYHAKIVTEDGTPLRTTPQIRVGMASNLAPACVVFNVFGNGGVEYYHNWRTPLANPKAADECPVTIRLSGYRMTEAVMRDGATIVLKRVGDHEGSTVALSSLRAPEDARKAYDKGVAALADNKLSAAQKNLERAVGIYPEYAQAWSELGDVYQKESKQTEARDAFEHASKADPKYIRPYVQLARLALAEHRIEDALEITNRALALRPIDVPGIYYYNAVANFNLKQYDAAEKSARQTIQADTDHEIPRAEHLLGLTLAAKGDRAGALEHMRKYVAANPKAEDAAEVKQQIEKLEQSAFAQKP